MIIMEPDLSRNRATPEDPRGIIAESYVIDDLSEDGARAIFLDWAMMDAPSDAKPVLEALLARFRDDHPDHPMTELLREGVSRMETAGKRRGRRQKS